MLISEFGRNTKYFFSLDTKYFLRLDAVYLKICLHFVAFFLVYFISSWNNEIFHFTVFKGILVYLHKRSQNIVWLAFLQFGKIFSVLEIFEIQVNKFSLLGGTLSLPTSSHMPQHHGEYLRACVTNAELIYWIIYNISGLIYMSENLFLCQNFFKKMMSTDKYEGFFRKYLHSCHNVAT